eukprot:CAMPEP_0194418086 /NCGR_PEP_ID=MMETSP0176-20130528/17165_1 /TAXON_ID=216777 /ORGANISM="Proboscia alata, Strain PI-D3" /LENGTH=49 /DNA_ID= /DNA_START= /DNA_END= /DNA_ORIENTATION=
MVTISLGELAALIRSSDLARADGTRVSLGEVLLIRSSDLARAEGTRSNT